MKTAVLGEDADGTLIYNSSLGRGTNLRLDEVLLTYDEGLSAKL